MLRVAGLLVWVELFQILGIDMLKVHLCICLGVGAASMAKLTFMVGGVEEEYNAAQELLTCMGANVVYCGQVGTGQVNMNTSKTHTSTHKRTNQM